MAGQRLLWLPRPDHDPGRAAHLLEHLRRAYAGETDARRVLRLHGGEAGLHDDRQRRPCFGGRACPRRTAQGRVHRRYGGGVRVLRHQRRLHRAAHLHAGAGQQGQHRHRQHAGHLGRHEGDHGLHHQRAAQERHAQRRHRRQRGVRRHDAGGQDRHDELQEGPLLLRLHAVLHGGGLVRLRHAGAHRHHRQPLRAGVEEGHEPHPRGTGKQGLSDELGRHGARHGLQQDRPARGRRLRLHPHGAGAGGPGARLHLRRARRHGILHRERAAGL